LTDSQEYTPLSPIDHRTVEWDTVARVAFSVHQRFAYEYPGPVRDLHQRLVVVPKAAHGDQRLRSYRVEADATTARRVEERDAFGNQVVSLCVPYVERRITFAVALEIERHAEPISPSVHGDAATRYLRPTRLTEPDAALREAARVLGSRLRGSVERRARTIARWVHERMRYAHDLTGVRTTAAEAFALGAGVCQDFAHVMLVLCRLNGIPARYVSGHLLGEGGTHAWVEVLAPAPAGRGRLVAHAYDPTHGRRVGLSYITVATGRDYADVPPTSGRFTAPYGGVLAASKQASITSIEFRSEDAPARRLGAVETPNPS
jgi:transglutaminase-like putative cysteine protease